MKNKVLTAFLFFTIIINSQVSDIANLTSGRLEMFKSVNELDGSIYGYLAIYNLDVLSKNEEKYEYLFLDKNLNKVANGEFVDTEYDRFFRDFVAVIKIKDEIIISKKHFYKGATVQTAYSQSPYKFTFTSHRSLNLKNNKISKPFYYENGKLMDGVRDVKKIKSITKKQKAFYYPVAFNEGFFMFEMLKEKKKDLKDIGVLKAFGLDKQLKWTYNYNTNKEKLSSSFQILDKENIVLEIYNHKKKAIDFHSLDPKTGKVKFKYKLENKKSEFNYLYSITALKNSFVIVGKFSTYNNLKGYNNEKAKGFFKIEIDKEGNELSKKYVFWKDLSPVIKIEEDGKLEDEYKLSSKRFFVFKDGNVSVINEKTKRNKNIFIRNGSPGGGRKTADFIVLNFNRNFDIQSSEVIEKEKTKWIYSNYLFSQKIDEDNGVSFFYVDSKTVEGAKSKNWDLGIVIIKEGKVYNEKVPMETEDYLIRPYKAKEGYILLREYSKDNEHDQIRLERLNYY